VFSLDIVLDFSLLLIFGLVLINLGIGVLPAWHPDWSELLRWTVAACAAVLLFASILVHELAHAFVGRALGTPVSGVTLFMFGGVAHLEREPARASAEFWMAIAGPVTSLVIGLASVSVGVWLGNDAMATMPGDPELFARHLGPVATLLLWLGPLNVALALFNSLPGFPLDGGRVLRAIVWWKTGDLHRATRTASQAGVLLSWLLIALGALVAFGFEVPFLGRGLGQGLWLMLIGWFLGKVARASYFNLITRDALERASVRDLMWAHPETTTPEQSLRSLVRQQMLHSDQQLFPVVAKEQFLLGAITLSNLHEVPEDAWDTTPVERVMIPRSALSSIGPETDAADVLRLLNDPRVQEVPVVERDQFLGLVRRRDVLRWLSIHVDPAQATL
jgi:Zn-dependent protease